MSFIFWICGQKPDYIEFCVVLVNKTMFRAFSSIVVWSFLVGEGFAEVSQVPCFSSLIFVEGSVAKLLSESLKNSRFLRG